jgi:hypothetical protein
MRVVAPVSFLGLSVVGALASACSPFSSTEDPADVRASDAGGSADAAAAAPDAKPRAEAGQSLSSEGLVLSLSFDEVGAASAKDSSGVGGPAELQGGARIEADATRGGGVLVLDGTGYAVTPARQPLATNTSTLTVAAWAKLGTPLQASNGEAADAWLVDLTSAWGIKFNTIGSGAAPQLMVQSSPVSYVRTDWTVPSEGPWHHDAVVFDRGSVTFYDSGAPLVLSAETGGILPSVLPGGSSSLTIGAFEGGSEGWLRGKLDDLRIYTRALARAEIEVLAKP